MLSTCSFVEFDTYNLPYASALFWLILLHDMFLSLQVFAFEGQNMTRGKMWRGAKYDILALYIVTPGPAVIRTKSVASTVL